MKTVYKAMSKVALAGLMFLAVVSTADAQRRGGGFRGGFHGGFGGRVYSPRVYAGPRVRVGVGLGLGYSGYYRPYAYPGIGLRIGVLPYGYYPFYWGPNQYYYYGGTFYAPYANGGYQVVAPPVGAEVPSLPDGAKEIAINGDQYYEFNGVYYKQVVNADGKTVYVVAGKDGVLNTDKNSVDDVYQGAPAPQQDAAPAPQMPQVGDMTDQLPEGARKITLNGKKYYVTPDNIYLEEAKTDHGTGYRVVSVPDQEDQDNNNQQ